ncbi:MAG: Hsp70 family protein [Gemmataceae bacterium]
MQLICPLCQNRVQIEDRHAGLTVKCGHCAGTFTAPSSLQGNLEPAPVTTTRSDPTGVPGERGSGLPFIGIDFGTCNSSMAWFNPKTGQAETLRNAEGEEKTPSMVYFSAQEILVGRFAEEMLESSDERKHVLGAVKRELAKPRVWVMNSRRVTPVEVAAEILKKLKQDAEQGHFHEPVLRAVITCPAVFDEVEKDKLREAATRAGFQEVELLEEPVAAALAYSQAGVKVDCHVLVYDLGGGTFDLAFLTREDGEDAFRLALQPQGDKVGGEDFDRAIYDHFDELFRKQVNRPICTDGVDLHLLKQCRKWKENLSVSERTGPFSLWIPDLRRSIKVEVKRSRFEELIREHVEKTIRLTQSIRDEALAIGYEVGSVILIGGSSRIPLVAEQLRKTLHVEPLKWEKQDIAVALGAAYHANQKWGEERNGGQKSPTPTSSIAVAVVCSSEEIQALIADGQGERAFDMVSKKMVVNPDEHLFDLWGDAATVVADADRVLATCREMYLQRRGDVWSSCCLASALETLHRTDEAERVLQPFLGFGYDRFFPVLLVRAAIAMTKDDTNVCQELLDRLLVMRPNYVNLLVFKATQEFGQNHVKTAEELLDCALRLNPNNLFANFLSIMLATRWADGPEAVVGQIKPRLAIMERIAPNRSWTRLCRAIYLLASQQPQASLQELDEAARSSDIRGTDGLALVLRFRVYCHQAMNAQESLRRDVEEWVRLDPKEPEARILRGNFLLAENRYAEGLENFTKALAGCPQSVDALIGSGWCNLNLGRLTEAVDDFVSAYRAAPGNLAVMGGATYALTFKVLMEELHGNFGNYNFYMSPHIPQDKLVNVLQSYAAGHVVDDSGIVLLFDNTFWGGAKDGFCISIDKLMAHNLWETTSLSVRLADIRAVGVVGDNIVVDGYQIQCGTLSDKSECIRAFSKLLCALAELHRHLLSSHSRCPKCGFSYRWDGVVCKHCNYRSR